MDARRTAWAVAFKLAAQMIERTDGGEPSTDLIEAARAQVGSLRAISTERSIFTRDGILARYCAAAIDFELAPLCSPPKEPKWLHHHLRKLPRELPRRSDPSLLRTAR